MKVIQIFVTNLFQNGQIPFFQLSHSSLIPLSTLFILPIPNYKLPKAICNAIISDRQVLAPSPPRSTLVWLCEMETGTRSDVAFVRVPVRAACPTRRDVLLAESIPIQYRGTLPYALPKKFFFPAEHQSEGGGHGLSKAIRARFSPVPITGEAIGFRVTAIYIYIYIAWIVSPGKNLFVAIWPATAAKGSSFIGRGERDEFFGKFLRFS